VNPAFIQTIKNTFGANGEAWLSALPDLITEACRRWNLSDVQPTPNLSYNFVAFARRGDEPVVLKIGVPRDELHSEIAALKRYNGQGACRMLEADPEKGTFLLERLRPGRMLSELEDDQQATQIAADVISQLWQPVPTNTDNFNQLRDWFKGFARLRGYFDGGTDPLPETLVERAESLSNDLLAENKDHALLHGDFHHYNLLESQRGWLAIDPKGVIGPKGYEVGSLLINPIDRFFDGSEPQVQTEKRIYILSERLNMERERIRAWAFCHAVLSAWWNLEAGGEWEYSIQCAGIFQNVRN